MTSLAAEIIAALSKPSAHLAAVPARTIAHDVIAWNAPYLDFHHLFHVRGDLALAWNVKTQKAGDPLPHEERICAWLASVTASEIARATPESPLALVERKPIAELPYSHFAIAHPAVAGMFGARSALSERCYLVFPCDRCEVATEMDADWASVQLANLSWAHLERERKPAARLVDYAAPKRPGTKPKPGKKAIAARHHNAPEDAIARIVRLGRVVEFEDCRNRTLRFANAVATELPDGPSRPIRGLEDARALLSSFLREGTFLEAPLPKDRLGEFTRTIEATFADLEDGVEPVFLEERSTRARLGRLWVKADGRTLDIAFALEDERLAEDDVPALVRGPYLRVLANGHWKGKIDTLRLVSRAGGPAREIPYA